MIALAFALSAESSEFVSLLAQRSRDDRGVITGAVHGHSVRVFHTGVGQAAAQAVTADFLARHAPALLISSGFTGALDDSLAVGDVLFAANYSTRDLPASLAETVRQGTLASTAAMLDSPVERTQLAARTGAIAVDMETEFIAAECHQRGVALLSLRAISDTPSAPFPLPPAVLFNVARQQTNYPGLLLYLARHPGAIGRLARFTGQVATARRSLATALDRLLRALPHS